MNDPDQIRTAVLFLWLLAEPVRLWTGYSGNLRENVSQGFVVVHPLLLSVLKSNLTHSSSLSFPFSLCVFWRQVPILLVFWLLTFFVSIPVSFYFSVTQMDIQPYDKAINIVVLVMLVLELGTGVHAVSHIIEVGCICTHPFVRLG